MNSPSKKLDILLGGRWAISLQGYLLAFPFMVLAAPLGNSVGAKNFPFLMWTFVSLIAVIPCTVILILLNYTIYKNRSIKPLPWWLIVVVGGLLGAIKGFLMTYIGNKEGLLLQNFSQDMEKRVLNTTIIGLTFVPIISFMVAGFDRYSSQRNKLLRQALSRSSIDLGANQGNRTSVTTVDTRVNARIVRDLEETRASLRKVMNSGQDIDGEQVAAYLRDRTNSSIRPLSHSLFNRPTLRIDAHGVRSAVRWGIVNLEIYPGAALLVYAVTSLASFYQISGLWNATYRFLIHEGLLATTLFTLRHLFKRYGRQKLYFKLFFTAIALSIFEVLTNLANRFLGLRLDHLPTQISEGLWVSFLIFLISGSMSVFMHEEMVVASLNSLITQDELQFTGKRIASNSASHDLARFLHTNLQTSMLNSANILDRAAAAHDADAIRREIDNVQTLLHLPDNLDASQGQETLESILNSAKRNWDGLMIVKSRFTGENKKSNRIEAKKLSLVLDEALSNAFRHGKAANVEIMLHSTLDELKVTVSDNGIGPTHGVEGMGSQIFDSTGGSSWELLPGKESGSCFVLALRRN
jgi:signal transduction histidine kinase